MEMEMEMETPPPCSSLNPKLTWTYDVFLSFRGEDTRKSFTDHLYAALNRKGIFTFRDDEELEKGTSIKPKLLKAIQESRFVIVILSRNYANSSWCLDELATMVDCMKPMGQLTILPIFYHVDPSEVRKQTGHYGRDFLKHEKSFRGSTQHQKLKRWRAALTQVANLSGWHLEDRQHRYESEIIEEVVENVLTELNQTISSVSKDLVGMDSRLREMFSYLEMGVHDVRVIGIWGMGGIGKTTLALVTSERIRAQFEGYSFLADVREVTKMQGPVYLQKQLLSDLLNSHVNIQNVHMGKDVIRRGLCRKMVLIVLDDVDQLEQVEALCDPSWFGSGSRIIITSRDEHLLRTYGVNRIYMAKQLTQGEALQLFSWKSFQKDQVEENFLNLSKDVLKYANGLPLAVNVLGSFLFGRNEKMWSSALDRLKEHPDRKILDVLEVSFDELLDIEKKLFLDIACFFKGQDIDRVTRILESCGHRPDIDIEVLKEKSLVTVVGRKLWMHDLIQKLGWEIVRRECREEPGKRSRLWLPKDIMPVLENNEGTNAVQGILLSLANRKEVHLNADPFEKMCKLRFLKIRNVNFSGSIKYLSNELQLLEWHGFPSNSLPSNFQSDKLVELRMNSSRIKQLWTGDKVWSMLRFIDLSDSQDLIKTPNFTRVPNLERLVLEDCTKLVEIHPSLGFLKNLIFLSMQNCKSVGGLPPFISLGSLKTIILSSCSKLKKFPEIEGNMKSLLELRLDGTAIKELPPSIEHLTGLTILNLGDCKNLVHLPRTMQSLTSLKTLILTGCSELDDIPESLNCVERLEELDISGTAIRELSTIAGMKNLKHLSFRGCKGVPSKSWHSGFNFWWWRRNNYVPLSLLPPSSLSGLSSLVHLKKLNLSGNNFVHLPESISQLSNLLQLDLSKCTRLRTLPKKLPLRLRHVDAEDCTSLTDFPNQYRVLASDVSGTTTISSLISPQVQIGKYWKPAGSGTSWLTCISPSENEKCKPYVDEFLLPTEVFQKDFERIDYTTYASPVHSICAQTDQIPEWFRNDHIRIGDSVETLVPPDLSDDGKWLGVAVCAVFSVKGHDYPAVSRIESDSETSNYLYRFKFGTPEFPLNTISIFDTKQFPNLLIGSPAVVCVSYIPCLYCPETFNKPIAIAALFETNNPFMEVRKCAIRLVFGQDAAGLCQVITRCLVEGHQHRVSPSPTVEKRQNCLCADCYRHEVANATYEAGWLNIIDKTDRWGEYPTSEGDSNILHRRNIEFLLRKCIEGQRQCGSHLSYLFFLKGCPLWFNPHPWLTSEPIQLPPTLSKSKKWMGLAFCVSVAVDAEKLNNSSYHISCHVTCHARCEGQHLDLSSDNLFHKHHLWVVYVPQALISMDGCQMQNQISTFIETDSPAGVECRLFGLRIVYQEDLEGLVQTVTRCIFRSPDWLMQEHNHSLVKDWLNMVRLKSHKFSVEAKTKFHTSQAIASSSQPTSTEGREIEVSAPTERKLWHSDWSVNNFDCWFRGMREIPNWFARRHKGGVAQIHQPPNMLDDGNWMGIAVCASLSIHEHPTTTDDPEFARQLIYHLQTDVAWLQKRLVRPISKVAWLHTSNLVWFIYLPRAAFSISLNQCNLFSVTVGSNKPASLGLHHCGLRLVFKEDVKELEEMLTLCESSVPKCHLCGPDETHA